MPVWTNRQVERLCLRYAKASREELLDEFAPHTYYAISAMARKLRVSRKVGKQRDWKAIARAHVPTFRFGG